VALIPFGAGALTAARGEREFDRAGEVARRADVSHAGTPSRAARGRSVFRN
jgi:hypothetical protein